MASFFDPVILCACLHFPNLVHTVRGWARTKKERVAGHTDRKDFFPPANSAAKSSIALTPNELIAKQCGESIAGPVTKQQINSTSAEFYCTNE